MQTVEDPKPNSLDLLDELSAAEDEFDVDLMACGCRYKAAGKPGEQEVTPSEFLKLYNFNDQALGAFVGALIDTAKLSHEQLHKLADSAARGLIKETETYKEKKPSI
jgi:hypothetical protein